MRYLRARSGAEDRPSVGGKVGRPADPAVLAVDLTGRMHHAGPGTDAVGLGSENVAENLDKFLRTEPTQPVGESAVHRRIPSRRTDHRLRHRHDLAASVSTRRTDSQLLGYSS